MADLRIDEVTAHFIKRIKDLERGDFVALTQLRLPGIPEIHASKTDWTHQNSR